MPRDPCALHIQIRQTLRGPWLVSERVYTVAELADTWHRQPKTIYNWLILLRKSPHAPRPEQVRLRRWNAVRRTLEIRADYARVMAQVFLEKNIRL